MTDQSKTTDDGATDGAALESAGTGGTQGSGSRDAETVDWEARAKQLQEREEAWKRQVEEAKEVKARLAEYEASASSPAVREDESERAMERLIANDPKVAAIIRANPALIHDPALVLIAEEREARTRAERQATLDRHLSRLPEAEAKEVEDHIRKNPGRFGDVAAARNDLRASRQDDEMKRLREENERLKRGPDPDVQKTPPTQGREYSARETKAREMTYEGYDAQLAEHRANGRQKEAFALQRELNEGKIRLKN